MEGAEDIVGLGGAILDVESGLSVVKGVDAR